jgi:hypothetical protein
MRVFERLVGLGSLECLKAFLIHQQVVFPISSGGVRLIFLKVIALITYLGCWALFVLFISSMFFLDFCPYLLAMIGANSLGPFFFQVQLKSM